MSHFQSGTCVGLPPTIHSAHTAIQTLTAHLQNHQFCWDSSKRHVPEQVKSPNILLTGGSKPYAKLGDLGLARMPGLYAASMDDTLKGTFNWLAPEMILNSPDHEVRLSLSWGCWCPVLLLQWPA